LLSRLRFRRAIFLFAALLPFGFGLFADTNGIKIDATGSIPPAELRTASLPPAQSQPSFRMPSVTPPAVEPATTASLPALVLPDSSEQTTEPFGIGASSLTSGGLVHKWRNVSNGMKLEQRVLEKCRRNADHCPPAAKRFLAVIEIGRKAQGRARIGLINRAINLSIRPVTDREQHGVDDLWATPLMTFSSRSGDCEDYAIAKYVALREAGIPESDLRLVVVRDNAVNDYHAVAAVRDNGGWLILDNRRLVIRHDVDIAEFNPLFTIGDAGVRPIQATAPKPSGLENYAKSAAESDARSDAKSERAIASASTTLRESPLWL